MNRKAFLQSSVLALSGVTTLIPAMTNGQQTNPQHSDPLKLETVKEFVGAGHGNLEKVQSMLTDYPNLIYCRYDWGNGDFEEAIEGAGHVGRKEIANFLISKGARVNLFVLTMLGKTELVKPILDSYPNLIFANGPHGFSLLHHAKVGGDDAKPLYEYLQEKGLKDMQVKIK